MLKIRDNLQAWTVDGEGVVYDPTHGMGHLLNPTAMLICGLCDGTHDRDGIQAALLARYPDSADTIRADVDGTIATLSNLGLLDVIHAKGGSS